MTRGSELGVGAPGSWKVHIRLRLVRLRVLVAERDLAYVIVYSSRILQLDRPGPCTAIEN